MNVTLVTEQFRRLFGWTFAEFDKGVAAAPEGAGGMTLKPYFVGERTPDLPLATGSISGITLQSLTAPNLARAAIEGVTAGLRYGLDRLVRHGIRPREIRLTGGGARSPVWRQIIADSFGVPVVKISEDECAALGAAVQAAWCIGGGSVARLAASVVSLDESTRCTPGRKR
jgi:sugar (pentulose or hexulose) kinase